MQIGSSGSLVANNSYKEIVYYEFRAMFHKHETRLSSPPVVGCSTQLALPIRCRLAEVQNKVPLIEVQLNQKNPQHARSLSFVFNLPTRLSLILLPAGSGDCNTTFA